MSKTDNITEQQQHWLDHIQASDAFNGTLVEYAKVEGLKVKDLYQWKTILMKRGFLASKAKANAVVPVQETTCSVPSQQATLVLPNGVRLELSGRIDGEVVKSLVLAACALWR